MIFFNKKRYLTILVTVVIFAITSCSKNNDTNPADNPPAGTPVNVNGKLFVAFYDSLMKLDAGTGTISWKAKDINAVGSAQSSLSYDSGLLCHGNYFGMTCYNTANGSIAWVYNWGNAGFNGNTPTNNYNVVFNDSLAYFASTTTGAWVSNLFCVNKKTGVLKWQQRIDFEYGLGLTNLHSANPVLSGDKILILGKDINGGRKIFCFNATSGIKLWETAGANSLLVPNFKVKDNQIFSVGQYAFCFDLLTGNQLWQSNISLNSSILSSCFFQNNNLIAIRQNTNNPCDVRVLDINTGNATSNFTLPYKYESCFSKNGIVYFTYVDTGVILRAVNASTGAQLWTYTSKNKVQPNTSWRVEHSPPVVTINNILFTETVFNNNIYKTDITVLDLNGNFVKEVPVNRDLFVKHFVFVDENGIVYKDTGY